MSGHGGERTRRPTRPGSYSVATPGCQSTAADPAAALPVPSPCRPATRAARGTCTEAGRQKAVCGQGLAAMAASGTCSCRVSCLYEIGWEMSGGGHQQLGLDDATAILYRTSRPGSRPLSGSPVWPRWSLPCGLAAFTYPNERHVDHPDRGQVEPVFWTTLRVFGSAPGPHPSVASHAARLRIPTVFPVWAEGARQYGPPPRAKTSCMHRARPFFSLSTCWSLLTPSTYHRPTLRKQAAVTVKPPRTCAFSRPSGALASSLGLSAP